MESNARRFLYKRRQVISVPDQSDKDLIVGYEASPTEVQRIENKYGKSWIREQDGKEVILLGGYLDYNNQGKNKPFFPPSGPASDPAILNGISNYALVRNMVSDPNFFNQASGKQSPNTSQTTNPSDQQGGDSSPITEQPNNESRKYLTGEQRLTYPSDMKPDQDRIMFHAHEYVSGVGGGRFGGPFGSLNPVTYTPLTQRVYLAIQSPISDQNSVGWEPDMMNPIELEAAKISMRLMKSEGIENITKIASESVRQALERSKVHEESIRTYLVGQAIGVNNLQSRLNGQVLNPNLELLFQGPQLRPFSFTFKMSARGREEAKRIKEIIRYFKENMAVKKGIDAVFLKAPNVFKIQYQHPDKNGKLNPHKSLNLIKMCALTNCSVDYTPLGTYMTYNDEEATMVAYTLSLQFQELTPIYDSDYEKFDYGDGKTVSIPNENSIGP